VFLCVLQVRTEWYAIFIPGGARDFALVRNVQTGSGAHRASCLVGNSDISEEVKRLVPDVDHWPPYCATVRNNWGGCTSAPPYALRVCTGTTLPSPSSRCKFSIGAGAGTKYFNTAGCGENLWIMIAGWDLSLVLRVVGCWAESWEVLNCLSEVNCGTFCCHRLLLNPWLT